MDIKISDKIKYVGIDDIDIDLFENQYPVKQGISYNSYLILDHKVALLDTVDQKKEKEWINNLLNTLNGRSIDYLIISHLEADHAGCIKSIVSLFKDITLVGNIKTFTMLPQFITINEDVKKLVIKENETLNLGEHTLRFLLAPMVHWPEVMVTYEEKEKILFSADAFGKFSALINEDDDWACEARRYYFNIVGKYGIPVQNILKKVSLLDIKIICPLHGPILKENLSYYLSLYNIWSSYIPEDKGILIVVSTLHGNTLKIGEYIKEELIKKGEEHVKLYDLSHADISEIVEDAFRYDRMILLGVSYDGGLFIGMEDFLIHLKMKAYQNRTVALIENGSWAPCANKLMQAYLENMKNITLIKPFITIKSTIKESDKIAIDHLLEGIAVKK